MYGAKKIDLKSFVNGAVQLGLIDRAANIYGLRAATLKKPHNLVNLFDECRRKLQATSLTWGMTYSSEHAVASKIIDCCDIDALVAGVPSTSPAAAFIAKAKQYSKSTHSGWDVRSLLNTFNFDDAKTKEDVNGLTAPLETAYPMLSTITSRNHTTACVIQYIADRDRLAALDGVSHLTA